MEDLGYDSHNSVLLLGSLGIFALWYWSRVLFYLFVLVPYVLLTGRGMKTAKGIKNKLFFTDFIAVTLEGYFEYIIAAYLNISRPLSDTNGEILGIAIGWYSAFLCLFLFPAIWLVLLLLPAR